MMPGEQKEKGNKTRRWTVSKLKGLGSNANPVGGDLQTGQSASYHGDGMTYQHSQNVYGHMPFANTTSNLRASANRISERTMDISQDLAGQTSHLVQASRSIAHEFLENPVLYDCLAAKFNSVITSIDSESFSGNRMDLLLQRSTEEPSLRGRGAAIGDVTGVSTGMGKLFNRKLSDTAANGTEKGNVKPSSSGPTTAEQYFSKAHLYANSTLSPSLPPLELYAPAWPLLCLAAQYSTSAYEKPSGEERDAHIPSDWRLGTKAMVIKSVPIDSIDCVVFAIRGTSTFMDWAVNMHLAPESPIGFLDDPGNLCHSGFLSVAKKMIKPVAARLRQLIEENPARGSCSLLMTGHSAGGAVASLLFAHMLSEQASSELSVLVGCFKRIHCVTFGAPPVTLLPLRKPLGERNKKSLFMSFINEGDPVTRADPIYVRSLLRLYASPAPKAGKSVRPPVPGRSSTDPTFNSLALVRTATSHDFVWEVPSIPLSNAGRLVLLRGTHGEEAKEGREEDVKAQITNDADLRSVVFGDPIMHMMSVYTRRIEVLATRAMTANLLA